MCEICGCGNQEEKALIRVPGEEPKSHEELFNDNEHFHSHDHYHGSVHHHHSHTDSDHAHQHADTERKTITVETDILFANKLMAERNRGLFEAKKLTVINLMSSPGSGKTTLLERTINELHDKIKISVIEGDQQTMNDAERINVTGVPVVQINTGNGCHLDAEMVNRAVKKLAPEDDTFILIENVGNLVCPSLFDLGEARRIVIMSVTEGEDKPLKYPNMFQSANLCILNKCDLLPYLDYDISKAIEYGHRVNPQLRFLEVSAKTGEGMRQWYDWLTSTDPW